MNKYTICVLLAALSGLSIATANATDSTSAVINPVATRGPGPVINPENSQYMENKNEAAKKSLQSKAHSKKHHAKKRHSHNKKH